MNLGSKLEEETEVQEVDKVLVDLRETWSCREET